MITTPILIAETLTIIILDHEIHQLLSIETDLYNIYKTINTILQEQA